MVQLGKRTDGPGRHDRAELDQWCITFARMYTELECDCRGAGHHAKRIRTMKSRINDSNYLKVNSVSPTDLVEAQNAIAQHYLGLAAREERISERVWAFPSFWKNRPSGADEFLTEEWFAYAPINEADDPVIECMVNRGLAECWLDVRALCRLRADPINGEPCPY